MLHPNHMDNVKGPEFLNYYYVNKDIIKIYLLLSSMDNALAFQARVSR